MLLESPEWETLPYEEKLRAIEIIGQDDPEYMGLPDEEKMAFHSALAGEPPSGGGLGGVVHSGLAGLAGGFKSLTDTIGGFHEAPARVLDALGAEEAAQTWKDYNPILRTAQAASGWLGEQEAEQAAQAGRGFLPSAANVLGQTPGVMAKFGLEMAGPGKLKGLALLAKGVGQVGGLELLSRLGRGEPLKEAATGAGTEAAMVGAFGGVGELAKGIVNPLARGLTHVAGTAGIGGLLEIPAVLSGERTPTEAAGTAIGLAALAGHSEYKTVKGLQARKAKLIAPVSEGGNGMHPAKAAEVVELERLGKVAEAKAIIDEWMADRMPPAPAPPPPAEQTTPPVVEQTQVSAETTQAPAQEPVVQAPKPKRQKKPKPAPAPVVEQPLVPDETPPPNPLPPTPKEVEEAAPLSARFAGKMATRPAPRMGLRELQPPKPTEQPVAKQPWEMTRAEVIDATTSDLSPGQTETLEFLQKKKVELERQLTEANRLSEHYRGKAGKTNAIEFEKAWKNQSRLSHLIDAMTEEMESLSNAARDRNLTRNLNDHRTSVEQALASGKPIPPEVLAEYPDLAPKEVPSAQKAGTPTQAGGPQEGAQGGAGIGLRLRDDAQNRVEAGAGTQVQGEGEVVPAISAPALVAKQGKGAEPESGADPFETNAGVLASRRMAELRKVKPRPLAKLYGKTGPTPEQAAQHAAAMREWNRQYRAAAAANKAYLASTENLPSSIPSPSPVELLRTARMEAYDRLKADIARKASKSILAGDKRLLDDLTQKLKEAIAEEPTPPTTQGFPQGAPPFIPTPRQAVATGPVEPVTIRDIQAHIEDVLDMPTAVGGFRGKDAGIWKGLAQIIRTKKWGNLDVWAHEVAHGLVERHFGGVLRLPVQVRNEFDALGKALYGTRQPAGSYTEEGFSEAMRYWLSSATARQWLQARAPAAYQWVEQQMATGNLAEVAPKLRALQDLYHRWDQTSLLDKGRSAMAWEPPKEKTSVSKVARYFTRMMADETVELGSVQKKLGVENAPYEHNPRKVILSNQGNAAGRAREAVEGRGLPDPEDPTATLGPSLKAVFEPIVAMYRKKADSTAAIKDFFLYMIGEHSEEVRAEGRRTDANGRLIHPQGMEAPMAEDVAQAWIAAGRARPEFVAAARGVTDFANSGVDYMVKKGAITEADGRAIKKYKFYIPFMREFLLSEGRENAGSGGQGPLEPGAAIRRMTNTGSTRPVKNPLESLITMMQRMIVSGDKAEAGRAFIEFAKRAPGAGKFVDVVDFSSHPNTVELRQLKKELEALGIDTSGASADSVLTYFTQLQHPAGPQNRLVTVKDGVRKMVEIRDPDLFESMSGMDSAELPAAINIIMKILGAPARVAKLGSTAYNAGFSLITQIIRDPMTSFVNTVRKDSAGHVLSEAGKEYWPALKSAVTGKENPNARGWVRTGGPLTTYFGQDTASTKHAADAVLAGGGRKGRLRVVLRHPLDAYRDVLSFSENVNRYNEFNAVYRKVYDEAIQEGLTPQKAHVRANGEATYAGKEVSVNFTRGGPLGRIINQVAIFYNPAMQGLRKTVVNLADPATRTKTIARAVTSLTIPGVALWLLNKDKDWWDNLTTYEKVGYMHAEVGGKIIRIPMPQEYAAPFYVLPMAILEAWRKKNREEAAKLTWEGTYSMIPNVLPTFPLLMAETMIAPNAFSKFKGRKLIPQNMEGMAPERQFTQYTPEVYKEIAGVINYAARYISGNPKAGVSPIVLQHLAEQSTGGLVRHIQGLTAKKKEAADWPVVGRLFTREGGGGRVIDEFYNQYNQAQTALKTLRDMQKDGDTEGARAYAKQFAKILGPGGTRVKILQEAKEKLSELRTSQATGEELQRLATAYLRAANRGTNLWAPGGGGD